MSAVKQTTPYRHPLPRQSMNGLPSVGAVGTGAVPGANVFVSDFALSDAWGGSNLEVVFFQGVYPSDAESRVWCTRNLEGDIGYYVINTLASADSGLRAGLSEVNELPLLPFALCARKQADPPSEIASIDAQRTERVATAELAKRIASLVPAFSETDLGRLAGVSRIAWRGWVSGETAARRGSRQRLLRLERILSLRERIDPATPLSLWLDSPIGDRVDVTPASLLADGRDQLVAILASRITAPQLDSEMRLEATDELSDLHSQAVDERLAARREIYADDNDDGPKPA